MAIYYKFKSEKDYYSLRIDAPFVSVSQLKILLSENIDEKRKPLFRARKPNFDDLIITNAQTNEDYLVGGMIPRFTSVVLRRVPIRDTRVFDPDVIPGVSQMPQRPTIVLGMDDSKKTLAESLKNTDSSKMEWEHEDFDFTDFGPEVFPTMESIKSPQQVPPCNDVDEKSKIEALVNKSIDGAYNKHLRRKLTWRNFGLESRKPPQGYVCHRCNVPGHFIQFCPTNGDSEYDIKREKPLVFEPNEAAFKKEPEGMSSKSSSCGRLLLELYCPLCKQVMRDAMMTIKCCFWSYCYKCIWDHITSKSKCTCGVVVSADDLVPNLTVRDVIVRIMSSDSSTITSKSSSKTQDQHSAKSLQLKGSYQKPSPQTKHSRSKFLISNLRNSNYKRKLEHISDHEENNRHKTYYPWS